MGNIIDYKWKNRTIFTRKFTLFNNEVLPKGLVECMVLYRWGDLAPGLWAVCDDPALRPAWATLIVHTAWSGKQSFISKYPESAQAAGWLCIATSTPADIVMCD